MARRRGSSVSLIVTLVVIFIVVGVTGWALGWFGEAVEVIEEEFSPSELLQKYEWFKDTAAELDAKRANIGVYNSRVESLKESYGDTPRSEWDRTDKEQYNLWIQEQAGVIASYNQLAADYNAQMAKFNWRFANVGKLPEGATEPVPREFQPYQESMDN